MFLRAIGASGPGVAHPTPIEQFLDGHPIAKAFVTSQPPPPESYATHRLLRRQQFQVHQRVGTVRVRALPSRAARRRALPHTRRSEDQGAELSDRGDSRSALTTAPVVFDWYAQIAQPGDKIDDPSIAWPEAREARTARHDHHHAVGRRSGHRHGGRSSCRMRIRALTPPIRC